MDLRELMAWLLLLFYLIALAYIIWDTYFVPDESDPNWHEQWEEQELAKARASCEATIEYLKEVAARPVPRWPEINLPAPCSCSWWRPYNTVPYFDVGRDKRRDYEWFYLGGKQDD